MVTLAEETGFMRTFVRALFALALIAIAGSAFAQSPNTSTLMVVVVDQTGAVVRDAAVTNVNSATGATRDAMSR